MKSYIVKNVSIKLIERNGNQKVYLHGQKVQLSDKVAKNLKGAVRLA